MQLEKIAASKKIGQCTTTDAKRFIVVICKKLSLPALVLSRAAAAEVAAAVRMMSDESSPVKHHVGVITGSK